MGKGMDVGLERGLVKKICDDVLQTSSLGIKVLRALAFEENASSFASEKPPQKIAARIESQKAEISTLVTDVTSRSAKYQQALGKLLDALVELEKSQPPDKSS